MPNEPREMLTSYDGTKGTSPSKRNGNGEEKMSLYA
jgi:hypothetical protein